MYFFGHLLNARDHVGSRSVAAQHPAASKAEDDLSTAPVTGKRTRRSAALAAGQTEQGNPGGENSTRTSRDAGRETASSAPRYSLRSLGRSKSLSGLLDIVRKKRRRDGDR